MRSCCWCGHLKLLVRHVSEELCAEINALAQRNELLDAYIEAKELPFPEDQIPQTTYQHNDVESGFLE